jgi:hypothetical protein
MPDLYESPDESRELGLPRRQAAGARQDADAPLADREVPLPGAADAHLAPAVQQWLDGEGSEVAARRADERQVEFWHRLGEEAARRRRMTTPAHVPQRIMEAIPAARMAMASPMATATSVAASTAEDAGRLSLSPVAALAAAAGLVALGFLIGRLA